MVIPLIFEVISLILGGFMISSCAIISMKYYETEQDKQFNDKIIGRNSKIIGGCLFIGFACLLGATYNGLSESTAIIIGIISIIIGVVARISIQRK